LSTLAISSSETIGVVHLFHPLVEVYLFPFVDDFHPKTKITLDWEAFIFVLIHSSHFSSSGPLGMVYELLQDCPKLFYEWLWPLFQSMWAHYFRSCSTFSVVVVLFVLIPIVGKVV
jgi:hypothetical protein